ncbi:MAG TPA: hypothetical protein PKD31_15065 [Blastocatellia bacterium]|nr:hypothetical protein [Blastocatellia bacterium]
MTAIILAAGLPTGRFAQQATQNPQQTQTPGQDTVRINTQLVQVDAVVTDKKGRHVEDLTQEDFELLVDGKKQPLTYFKHINLPNLVKRELAPKKKTDAKPAPESMPTRQIEPSQVQRTLAFIVDDLGLSFRARNSSARLCVNSSPNKCRKAIWSPSFAQATAWECWNSSPATNAFSIQRLKS